MALHKDSGKVGMIVILAQAFGREQCSQWKLRKTNKKQPPTNIVREL